MNIGRKSWSRLGMSTLSILSAVGLFNMVGILPTTSSPIAAALTILFCMVGLRHFYEGLFALVALIVHVKSQELVRRRGGAHGA
jgi:hypothetical protein